MFSSVGNKAVTTFANYEATVDIPACFYDEKLMREFPEATVLLNLRAPDKWYDSFITL